MSHLFLFVYIIVTSAPSRMTYIHSTRVLDFLGWFSRAVENALWNNSFNNVIALCC